MSATTVITRVAVVVLLLGGCSPARPAAAVPLADDSAKAVAAAIDAITTFPTTLDPRLWNGTDIKPEVRQMSLKIVERLVDSSRIPGLTVEAVELFGSNASYEYDDTSDFGVHVFTHSAALSVDDLGNLLRLLNDAVERRQEGRITFNGVPVEVTFHSERTAGYRPSPGIGQYSLSEGRWIEKAVAQPDHFDRAQMAIEMKRFIGEYNALASAYAADKAGFACSRFGDLDREMSTYRNSGFDLGLGSRSTQNLTYRGLRRLNVSIPDMVDELEDDCTFVQESIG